MSNNISDVSVSMHHIPKEVMEAFIFPQWGDRNAFSRVCKVWNAMVQPSLDNEWIRILDELTFGKARWLKIPGVKDVGEEPALSAEQVQKMKTALRSICPFFNQKDDIQPHRFENDKTKRVWQTHVLILFPETINGEPRTVNSIGKIFKFLCEGEKETAYECIYGDGNKEYSNTKAPKSYWRLVTKDVVPGSRRKTRDIKESLVKGKGYQVPTPSEAATAVALLNIGPSQTKTDYFFGREGKWWTYTTTTEECDDWRLIVGAAAPSGFEVGDCYGGSADVGVAGFSEIL